MDGGGGVCRSVHPSVRPFVSTCSYFMTQRVRPASELLRHIHPFVHSPATSHVDLHVKTSIHTGVHTCMNDDNDDIHTSVCLDTDTDTRVLEYRCTYMYRYVPECTGMYVWHTYVYIPVPGYYIQIDVDSFTCCNVCQQLIHSFTHNQFDPFHRRRRRRRGHR